MTKELSMSRYPWHPASRPPPADSSLAANIALLGRVGKCLEAALDEIQKEDDDAIAAAAAAVDDGGGSVATSADSDCDDRNKAVAMGKAVLTTDNNEENWSSIGQKRKYSHGDESSSERRSKTQHYHDAEATTAAIRMDKSISKSIMEAYGKAVAESNFDPTPSSEQSNLIASNSAAPAAMLTGEIDHYNRIGDRWRIVIKNAVIKPRKTTIITNGMTGTSLRRRHILDWDDEGSGGGSNDAGTGGEKKKCGSGSLKSKHIEDEDNDEAYHFKGTVQILAYDD
ncbi:hypothetical protein ACHAWC_001290 [Mediolabrus comicus]